MFDLASTPKLILAVVLIVCIGAVMGLMGWALTKKQTGVLEVKTPDEIVKEETTDWQTYQNEEFGFEMKYPDYLEIKEYASGIAIEKLISESVCSKEDTLLYCAANLRIGFGLYPDGIQQYFETGEMLTFKQIVFNGIEAFERNGSRLEQGERSEMHIQQRKIVFEVNNTKRRVYEIRVEYPKSLESELEVKNTVETFNKILSSFKFIEK